MPTIPCNHPRTPNGEPHGWIEFAELRELWIHTGTACNLRCPTCFEGAKPGNFRLEAPSPADIARYADEAQGMGVRQFGVTGGEPFVNAEILPILRLLSERAPCLVLSNGTEPLSNCLPALRPLAQGSNTIRFRISLDYPDASRHDAGRGRGAFALALRNIGELLAMGFAVSVARRLEKEEDTAAVTARYQEVFVNASLPESIALTAFPDLQCTNVPHITEHCIRTYHTPESCQAFMCAYSRMLVRQNGAMRLYACTLTDDDTAFDFGPELPAALKHRTYLTHDRCFACFSNGVSCGKAG